MLIQVGEKRTVAFDLRLAIWLALAAGAVNAAGFRSLGYFSANMTGNVSAMSDMLALRQWIVAAGLFALLAAFIFGAFISAVLIEAGRRRQIRGIYALSILLEALLLLALTVFELTLPQSVSAMVMLAGLSFLMGLQNAATTRISDARVRTSHVSGIATDIGIELAALLDRKNDTKPIMRSRLKLHSATLLSFFGGGVAGVLGYEWIGPYVFAVVSVFLLALSLPALRHSYAARPSGSQP